MDKHDCIWLLVITGAKDCGKLKKDECPYFQCIKEMKGHLAIEKVLEKGLEKAVL